MVSNTKLTGQNTTDNYTLVQFDLTWQNSWRTSSAPNNWDAAWVFVKYRVGSGEWQHASLNNTGHSGTGATIDVGLLTPGTAFNAITNPGLGAFIYRSANGTGTFTITGAQLRWNYGANSVADDATVDVQVFAIEMVYVPRGSFYLGSGGAEYAAFYSYPTTTNTFEVNSENEITVGTQNGNLYYNIGESFSDQGGPIPANFPKGYNAFYCQKYEITQQQYVDFLNTLTQTQATTRKYDKPVQNYRYEITGSTVGSYTTTNPYVPCCFMTWMDDAAYSDWAGLRPMTELEYEKACRGTVTPVANEFAWGNTTATVPTGINNAGTSNETPSNSDANSVYLGSGAGGPVRVGAFARGSSNRAESGASYYGIMELSGNVWERPVTVGNATGRAFTGVHGNGVLNTDGFADQTAWPGLISGAVTSATGSGFRGGAFWDNPQDLRTSDRFYSAKTDTDRYGVHGFRAVRQAPELAP